MNSFSGLFLTFRQCSTLLDPMFLKVPQHTPPSLHANAKTRNDHWDFKLALLLFAVKWLVRFLNFNVIEVVYKLCWRWTSAIALRRPLFYHWRSEYAVTSSVPQTRFFFVSLTLDTSSWNSGIEQLHVVNSALNNCKRVLSAMSGRIILPTVSSRSARHLARSFNGQEFTGYEEYTEPLLRRNTYDSVHYESIYDSTEFSGSQRNRVEVMRKRLKSHFMTPYQKYKHRGRKPWKLLFQFLKLIMVTVQVCKQTSISISLNLSLFCLHFRDEIIEKMVLFFSTLFRTLKYVRQASCEHLLKFWMRHLQDIVVDFQYYCWTLNKFGTTS